MHAPRRIITVITIGITPLALWSCGDGGQGPSNRPTATISGMISLTSSSLAPPAAKPTADGPAIALPAKDGKARAAATLSIRRAPISRPGGQRFVPDELVITYHAAAVNAPPIGSRALAAAATTHAVGSTIRTRAAASLPGRNAHVVGVSPALLAARVRAGHPSELPALMAHLRADPSVKSVERNALYSRLDVPTAGRLATRPNDFLYAFQAWNYEMLDLPRAWDITRGAAGVLVAVLDDGIRFDHPDVAPNLSNDGYDFVTNIEVPLCAGGMLGTAGDGDDYDDDPTIPSSYVMDEMMDCAEPVTSGGHGLHVAGTIGAVGGDAKGVVGVNWTVRIRPVRVMNVTGSATGYDVAQGILYAAGLPADDGEGGTVTAPSPARVINMSLGGPEQSSIVEQAVIDATNAGTLIVASAGNTPTSVANYPAAYEQVLSVSAVGPDGLLASYSSFGPTVDIAAPGGDYDDGGDITFTVLSAWWDFAEGPVYAGAQGTSMAAPHVTGVAALLLAQNPTLTPAQMRNRLTSHAVDIGTPGADGQYGAGLVNARNSLTQTSAAPAALYARLYAAGTGGVVRTVAAQSDGAYSFPMLENGNYLVFAGQDENNDMSIGVPGRRWGANGGSAAPTPITVSGVATYTASFTIGLPAEVEPNGSAEGADALALGGYITGAINDPETDLDLFKVAIPNAGQYTFETVAVSGACGFALEEDTILGLFDSGGNLIIDHDDINATAFNFCSRITRTMTPGTYYVGVIGYLGGRYRVSVRSGS